MVVAVFSTTKRPGLDQEAYQRLNNRMWEIVSTRPEFGLVSIAGFKDDSGRPLTMVFFRDRDGLQAWRQELEHQAAQRRGRHEFYLQYWGFDAELLNAFEFHEDKGRTAVPLDSTWRPPGFEGPS